MPAVSSRAMGLTDDELLAAFDAAVAAFAELPDDRWDAPVPACPGWTLADLVSHVARVQGWAAFIVATRPEKRPVRDDRPLPAGVDRLAFLAGAAADLRAALVAADLDAPVYS